MPGGRRGPAPLPSAIKRARGTQKSTRVNKREPTPKRGDPGIPEALRDDKEGKALWLKLSKQLDKMKVLTVADGIALEGLIRAYLRAAAADREIKKHGLMVKTAWGTLQGNPAVSISRSSWSEVRKFAQEFGLTPSSRSRVTEVSDDENEQRNKEEGAADFLFRKRAGVVGAIG
jgi:P27 family predicted phage terminase small subunit